MTNAEMKKEMNESFEKLAERVTVNEEAIELLKVKVVGNREPEANKHVDIKILTTANTKPKNMSVST